MYPYGPKEEKGIGTERNRYNIIWTCSCMTVWSVMCEYISYVMFNKWMCFFKYQYLMCSSFCVTHVHSWLEYVLLILSIFLPPKRELLYVDSLFFFLCRFILKWKFHIFVLTAESKASRCLAFEGPNHEFWIFIITFFINYKVNQTTETWESNPFDIECRRDLKTFDKIKDGNIDNLRNGKFVSIFSLPRNW